MDAMLSGELPVVIDGCVKGDVDITNIMSQIRRQPENCPCVFSYKSLRQLELDRVNIPRRYTISMQRVLAIHLYGLIPVSWQGVNGTVAIYICINIMLFCLTFHCIPS